MREILFYHLESGRCPVVEFLDKLTDKQFEKVSFVLDLIEHLDFIPQEYLKKLKGSDDIWEVRVQYGNNIFRLLGFFEANNIVIPKLSDSFFIPKKCIRKWSLMQFSKPSNIFF
jgi:hypothetical protein